MNGECLTRTCKDCGIGKALGDYPKNSRSSLGRTHVCSFCTNLKQRKKRRVDGHPGIDEYDKIIRDLQGLQFGRLLVLEKDSEMYHSPSGRTATKWICKCDCGVVKSVLQTRLRSGKSTSCGCKQVERMRRLGTDKRTHGMSKHPVYMVWKTMKARCLNPNDEKYPAYGGRGIKVCDRWLESFENFLEDMEERPSDKHSVERLDVDGDYCKSNCVWETNDKQSRNRKMVKSNTSGTTGVRFDEKMSSWVATAKSLSGKDYYKSFSLKKYGDSAKALATEAREGFIKELNELGAGYSEKHGQK